MINRGYHVGLGGLDQPPPCRPAPKWAPLEALWLAVKKPDSRSTRNPQPVTPPSESSSGPAIDSASSQGSGDASSTREAAVGSGSVYDSLGASVAAPGAKLEFYERPFGTFNDNALTRPNTCALSHMCCECLYTRCLLVIVSLADDSLSICWSISEFLSLGIMAYVGDEKALTQIEAGPNSALGLKLYGSFAFLLWRSVYITKQVGDRPCTCSSKTTSLHTSPCDMTSS